MVKGPGRRVVVACAAALLTAASLSRAVVAVEEGGETGIDGGEGPAVAARAQRASDRWNAFSAEVTVRRGVRDAEHKPVGQDGPALRYRWRRVQVDGRWSTTMEILSPTRAAALTPSSEARDIVPGIARVEDPGDGSGLRYFTPEGVLVTPPTGEQTALLNGSSARVADPAAMLRAPASGQAAGLSDDEGGWIDAVMPAASRKRARRAALQQRFGRLAGTLRGFDRFVAGDARETTEVLVQGEWNVPVEINVVRDGTLHEHTTFGYEAGAGGSLLRRRSRAERLIPDSGDLRLALDVELTNVALSTEPMKGGR